MVHNPSYRVFVGLDPPLNERFCNLSDSHSFAMELPDVALVFVWETEGVKELKSLVIILMLNLKFDRSVSRLEVKRIPGDEHCFSASFVKSFSILKATLLKLSVPKITKM